MDYGDLKYDLDRCRDFLETEKYEEAWEIAQELYARSPHDSEVTSVYADAALANGEAALAIRACRKILRTGSSDVEVLEMLARAEWELGLSEPCRDTCRRILTLEPDNYAAIDYGLATVLELGDFDRAADLIEHAIARHEHDPHLSYQIAVVRMMRGEEEWALERFEEILAQDPEEPSTYINLMRIHHLAGRYGEAQAIFERADALGLEHEDLSFNMGLALKADGKERRAVPYFMAAIRMAEEKEIELPDACFHLGQILRSEGHPRLALSMLERELRIDDTHPAVHAEMAWCEEDLGNFEDGVRMIRAAVERAPDWGVYWHSLAELILKARGSTTEAEDVARKAVSLAPDHAAGWQILGRLAGERDELATAEKSLRRALTCQDATAEDQGWLGLVLVRFGRFSEAIPFLEVATRVYPFWEIVGTTLGRLRGDPLPTRYEVRLTGATPSGRRWYRVLHVVARDETGARNTAMRAGQPRGPGRGEVEEVRTLGFEVDLAPGVVWDSGQTGRRYPGPPPSRS